MYWRASAIDWTRSSCLIARGEAWVTAGSRLAESAILAARADSHSSGGASGRIGAFRSATDSVLQRRVQPLRATCGQHATEAPGCVSDLVEATLWKPPC